MAELEDLREHLERYRAVTLQALDLLKDEDLAWRPGPDHFTLGQQFEHIARSEDIQIRGQFTGEWDYERARFSRHELGVEHLRALLCEARHRTLAALDELDEGRLDEKVVIGDKDPANTRRWWLWLLVEHEVHHKAQIAVYLRQMGKMPPFFAAALEEGARPDVEMTKKLGGF
jgi:uncharacterized damage-inducible protein DinB